MAPPILLPRIANPGFNTPGRNPAGGVEINPLSAAMFVQPITEADAYAESGGSDFYIAGTNRNLIRPGNFFTPVALRGGGWDFTSANPMFVGTHDPLIAEDGAQNPNANYTLIVKFRWLGTNGSSQTVVSKWDSSSAFEGRWHLHRLNGGTWEWRKTNAVLASGAIPRITAGAVSTIVITGIGPAGNHNVKVFANGGLAFQNLNSGIDFARDPTASIHIGGLFDGATPSEVFNGQVFCVGFGRYVPDGMAEALSLDPYLLIRPVSEPLFFFPAAATGVTGTGAAQAGAAIVTATGERIVTGSAAVAAQAATAAATAERVVTGSTAAAAQAATVSAEGTVTGAVTGSVDAAAQAATVTAVAERTVTGTSAAAAQAATVAAIAERTITGTSAVAAQAATVDATGTVEGAVTGSVAAAAQAATVAAVGERVVTGSSAVAAQAVTVAAVAERAVTGASAAQADAATVSATGTRTVTGDTAAQAGAATVEATGTAGAVVSGTAAAAAGAAQASVSGAVTKVGSADVFAGIATASAQGTIIKTGDVDVAADAATVSATGVLTRTGVVAAAAGAAEVSIVGFVGEVPTLGEVNAPGIRSLTVGHSIRSLSKRRSIRQLN